MGVKLLIGILKLFGIGVGIGISMSLISYISEKTGFGYTNTFQASLLAILILIFVLSGDFLKLSMILLVGAVFALFVLVFIGLGVLFIMYIMELFKRGGE